MFLLFLFITLASSCTVQLSGVDISYGYLVNFNVTTSQPNYVGYNNTRIALFHDCAPYKFPDVGYITYDTYINSGYEPAPLVPPQDYGNFSCSLLNMVPLNTAFMLGAWKKSVDYIRNTFPGAMVYKGCDYDYRLYKTSSTDVPLYLALGCYFVVLQEGELVYYGYLQNSPRSTIEKRLPWWISCPASPPPSTSSSSRTTFLTLVGLILYVFMIYISG